ncbi:MAG: ATP-binding protein [Desulfotignum sp.]|nr:ATP-binding protein [Desulfotignum sp.]
MQQCLINLIFNAIDAIEGKHRAGSDAGKDAAPPGQPAGRIRVTADFEDADRQVCIRLEDDGKGIFPEDLPRIFEPFFTTKNDGHGVGLGLSTVFGIIEHHNGTITVDSQPGRGTCFTIRLPAGDETATVKEANL